MHTIKIQHQHGATGMLPHNLRRRPSCSYNNATHMPNVVVVCVALRLVQERLSILLVDGDAPALPMRDLDESSTEGAAQRALVATLPCASAVVRCESFGVFSEPARSARRREIALASWAVVRPTNGAESERIGSGHRFVPFEELPALIDDHAAIAGAARRALDARVLIDSVTRRVLPRHLLRAASDRIAAEGPQRETTPVLFGLLPDPFPLSAIRLFYERLLGAPIDRGNFRRKLVELRPTGILKELPLFQRGVRHRAAQLFTFDRTAWEDWSAAHDE